MTTDSEAELDPHASSKKYELLLDDTIQSETGETLFRIRALRHVVTERGRRTVVEAGTLGGYVQSERNLSHSGNAWVFQNGQVYQNAIVEDDAIVAANARVHEHACISGRSEIDGHARVCGHVHVYGAARVYDHARLSGKVVVCDSAVICKNAEVTDEVVLFGRAYVGENAKLDGNRQFNGFAGKVHERT